MGHVDGLNDIKVPSIDDAKQEAARKTVCHFAADAAEARELLLMLGLAEVAEVKVPLRCGDCGDEMGRRRDVRYTGSVYLCARGLCERCYSRWARAEKKATA